VKFRDEEIN